VYEYVDWVMDDELHDWLGLRVYGKRLGWFWDWWLLVKDMGMGYTRTVFSLGNLVFRDSSSYVSERELYTLVADFSSTALVLLIPYAIFPL